MFRPPSDDNSNQPSSLEFVGGCARNTNPRLAIAEAFPSKLNMYALNGVWLYEIAALSTDGTICDFALNNSLLAVANSWTNQLMVFCAHTGKQLKTWGGGAFVSPTSVVIVNNRVYVLDRFSNRVQSFT